MDINIDGNNSPEWTENSLYEVADVDRKPSEEEGKAHTELKLSGSTTSSLGSTTSSSGSTTSSSLTTSSSSGSKSSSSG